MILIGTASWTDRDLVASGWYPPGVTGPEAMLRHYARRFPLVEVDSTYYAPPSERTTRLWVERTPPGFTFNITAYSLFTGHPTRLKTLPADLRARAEPAAGPDGTVSPRGVDPALTDAVWDRFLAALSPLRDAGRLGAVLLRFPPWFRPGAPARRHILECARRCAPIRVCVEFRHRAWLDREHRAETLRFLTGNDLPYVCVDMPQGHPSSVPPLAVATSSDLAVVRFHGRSARWAGGTKRERYAHRYSDEELGAWVDRIAHLDARADTTHVLFNNNRWDDAPCNAARMRELLAGHAGGGAAVDIWAAGSGQGHGPRSSDVGQLTLPFGEETIT